MLKSAWVVNNWGVSGHFWSIRKFRLKHFVEESVGSKKLGSIETFLEY